ncbi:MAG: lysophospholipid acyltransferase family protein [Chitinivibrionales bacterium]
MPRRPIRWKRWRKRRKNDAIYLAVRLIVVVARLLPRTAGTRIFGWLGGLVFLLPTKDRRRTHDHLRFIFGERWTKEKIRQTARAVYVNLGKNFFDALYFSRCTKKQIQAIVHTDDLTKFKQAYQKGKGVIVITSHVGCFEMLLHYFAHIGFSCFAIGSKLYDKRLDRLVARLRSGEGIDYMHREGSGRNVIRMLKRGKVFGVLIDQDTKVDGVFAHFLGHLAYTPSAPVRMGLRYDIPMVVMTTHRAGDDTHHIAVSDPIQVERTDDFTRDMVQTIEYINDMIGEAIKKHPEQWVWMHRRWHRRPDHSGFSETPSIEDYVSGDQ